ncbi:MAG: archaeosortase/exosortase family protein [Minicystis sp.]
MTRFISPRVRDDLVFMGVLFVLAELSSSQLADPLNELLAGVSYRGTDFVLGALGVPHTADAAHRVLGDGQFEIEVAGECSGLRSIALLGAALILLPLPRRRKVVHFALGAVALMAVNVVRLAHLFQLGEHETLFHVWLWPTVIVGGVLVYRHIMLPAGLANTSPTADSGRA